MGSGGFSLSGLGALCGGGFFAAGGRGGGFRDGSDPFGTGTGFIAAGGRGGGFRGPSATIGRGGDCASGGFARVGGSGMLNTSEGSDWEAPGGRAKKVVCSSPAGWRTSDLRRI